MNLKYTKNQHICVEGLNVYYKDEHILKDINITIPDKKITVILGPSGCGKTTLLKTFNRIIEHTGDFKISGKVLIDGENIYNKKVETTHIRKKMGLLIQKPCPLPMSIFDNIAYGPRINGVKNKKILHKIVEYNLKEVNLWDEVKDKINKPAVKLSIGQQQRLCLARALAVDPEIILGDEPTSALDPISSIRIENKFQQLKQNITIVLVTHILRQAKRLADYVVFIYMGEIIEHGPAAKIFSNPKNKLTKEFINGIIY